MYRQTGGLEMNLRSDSTCLDLMLMMTLRNMESMFTRTGTSPMDVPRQEDIITHSTQTMVPLIKTKEEGV